MAFTMKKNILFLALVSLQSVVFAQTASTTEGVIYFEEKRNLHKMIKDEAAKAMVPEFRSNKMDLYFRGDECLYKPSEEEEDEAAAGGGGGGFRMRFPQGEVHRNFATERRVEQREMMGKKYLIIDTMKTVAWKLTGETKKILNYDCMKATYNDTARKQNIVAWFTDAIPLTAGPSNYGSLPGMILAVDINDSEMVWLATKIDFKKIKDVDIKAPTKGEQITGEEFRKKMREMRPPGGGPNGRMIIRN